MKTAGSAPSEARERKVSVPVGFSNLKRGKIAWSGSSLDMLLQNAAVHYNIEPGFHRAPSRLFIDHSLLKPHAPGAQSNRFIDVLTGFFAPPKDIHQIDLLGHVFKLRIGFLAKRAGLVRVHRYDSISV